jgi:hypothetical protein
MKGEEKAIVAWLVFCALVGLAVLGVVVWAVIELVTWVTAQ